MSKFSGYPPGLSRLDRRRFLKASAISAGTFLLGAPAFLLGKGLNDKLNIAIIGAGRRGAANTGSVSSENIVALCDISETNLNQAAAKHPAARKYVDFRKEIRTDYSEMRLEETLALTPALVAGSAGV